MQNGDYTKWYCHDSGGRHYINKKQRSFAEKLAVKKFYSLQLQELLKQKEAMDLYIASYAQISFKSMALLSDSSPYHELLSSHFTPLSDELYQWEQEPYEANPKHPENRIHQTFSGRKVRSKSEVMIDTALTMHKIPFHYEQALKLNERLTFYPDFTIRHPSTGATFYWEHFGQMDNLDYSRTAFHKLQEYNDAGYIPSIHLITTFETKDNPLTPHIIEDIIHRYFDT